MSAFAKAVVDGLDLEAWQEPDDLTEVPAHARPGTAWRLGMLDAFPSDVSGYRGVEVGVADRVQQWRPWRGLAAAHLLADDPTVTKAP